MTIKSVLNPSVIGDNVIEISPPRMRHGSDGRPVLDDRGLPLFDHVTPGDFWTEKNVPIKSRFFLEYLQSAPSSFIAVFIALADMCDYSQIRVRVNDKHELVTNGAGDAIVEMTRHGNRTRTKTYEQIAKDANVHPDTARKAIKFWLKEGTIKEIAVDEPTAKKISLSVGKPIKTLRFEMNPKYVWNGPIVERTSYETSGRF